MCQHEKPYVLNDTTRPKFCQECTKEKLTKSKGIYKELYRYFPQEDIEILQIILQEYNEKRQEIKKIKKPGETTHKLIKKERKRSPEYANFYIKLWFLKHPSRNFQNISLEKLKLRTGTKDTRTIKEYLEKLQNDHLIVNAAIKPTGMVHIKYNEVNVTRRINPDKRQFFIRLPKEIVFKYNPFLYLSIGYIEKTLDFQYKANHNIDKKVTIKKLEAKTTLSRKYIDTNLKSLLETDSILKEKLTLKINNQSSLFGTKTIKSNGNKKYEKPAASSEKKEKEKLVNYATPLEGKEQAVISFLATETNQAMSNHGNKDLKKINNPNELQEFAKQLQPKLEEWQILYPNHPLLKNNAKLILSNIEDIFSRIQKYKLEYVFNKIESIIWFSLKKKLYKPIHYLLNSLRTIKITSIEFFNFKGFNRNTTTLQKIEADKSKAPIIPYKEIIDSLMSNKHQIMDIIKNKKGYKYYENDLFNIFEKTKIFGSDFIQKSEGNKYHHFVLQWVYKVLQFYKIENYIFPEVI